MSNDNKTGKAAPGTRGTKRRPRAAGDTRDRTGDEDTAYCRCYDVCQAADMHIPGIGHGCPLEPIAERELRRRHC